MGQLQCCRRLCYGLGLPLVIMGVILSSMYILEDLVCRITDLTPCCYRYVMKRPAVNTRGRSTRNNVLHQTRFLLNSNVCQESVSQWMVIGVVSHVRHVQQRSAVRDTWGSLVKGQFAGRMALIFVVAQDINPDFELEKDLQEEHYVYGDIVQINAEEKYCNLVKKSIALLKWASENCDSYKYLLKIDEDVFPNLHKLVPIVEMFYSEPKFIMGLILRNSKPNRNRRSKHFVSVSDYPWNIFPDYINGAAYVISGILSRDILAAISTTSLVRVEDVFITGICSQSAGAVFIGNCGFSFRHVPIKEIMKYPGLLTFHNYTHQELRTLWTIYKTFLHSY